MRPVSQPYRRVPIPLEKKIDEKLDQLLAQGIIEPVIGPSTWVSPIVPVLKGVSDVRICIDMRRANEAIKRERHPLPVVDNLLTTMRKSTKFSRLDISNAFHQVEISPESRYITTFITKKGLFQYTRLMFGISCAPEMFQKIIEKILIDCKGCFNFLDDILVFGKDDADHDDNLCVVKARLNDYNVLLNLDKCLWGVKQMEFLGHRISENGIQASERKIEAIKNFRPPSTAEELRSLLGLVNYLAKFIPDLATITTPLRELLRSNKNFTWENQHNHAFNEIKHSICQNQNLGYFDPQDKTQIIADASPTGLGAVLVQIKDNIPRVIYYASRSLSQLEMKYCQSEKEALALVWSVEKFHNYVFGMKFELITDCKALEFLFSPRSRPCARLERWILRIQAYKFVVIHKPGLTNISDSLSRLSVMSMNSSSEDSTETGILSIAIYAVPIALKIDIIREETQKDLELLKVKEALQNECWDDVELKSYKPFRMEFCIVDGLILRNDRLVIPRALRNQVLDLAHQGHPGIVSMKVRLRSKVWWPSIDNMAEKAVKQCKSCLQTSSFDPPEPMVRRKFPSGAWSEISMDFLGPLPSGETLLIVIDNFSRFAEVMIMRNTSTFESIRVLRELFARYGIPTSITADNGPQFISQEFKDFCEELGICLNNTVPYWPQMNGEAERFNRTLLRRLKISQLEKND